MKSNIEIFDKDGKALDIADVISRFIEIKAENNSCEPDEIGVYFEGNGYLDVCRVTKQGNYVDTIENIPLP